MRRRWGKISIRDNTGLAISWKDDSYEGQAGRNLDRQSKLYNFYNNNLIYT